ncbi:hypothetical protein H0O00_01970 [Candidatus Micrarchaeota archaeon]|nr:hypothetical protein [Candidatus Micrarchaeota archaeon]
MATSNRRVRSPSLTFTQVSLLESDPSPIERPDKRKDKKKLISFQRSPDRHSFAHLAKILTSGEREAMLNAVDRLRGKSRILVELACFSTFQFVRLAAVTNLSRDIEALVDVAKYCHFADTRASAVDELAHEYKGLVEIACSSLFKDTRIDAVSTLKDSNSLADVASCSPNKDSRDAALKRVSENKSALKKVAEETAYRSSRLGAITNLSSDPASLSSLALSKNSNVNKLAASKLASFVDELDDPEALVQIAKLSPNEDARYIAVGRLSRDPWSLRAVVTDAQYPDARSTALMLLSDMVNELDDPEILADVATSSPYPDCRSAAIERLIGQSSALLSVASNSKFKETRGHALDKLKSDVASLKSASRLSKYPDTRKKAHKMVSKPEVFEAELSRILG